jgi:hypothetical protein
MDALANMRPIARDLPLKFKQVSGYDADEAIEH